MAPNAKQIRDRLKQELKNDGNPGNRSGQVYWDIREQILDGRYHPGDKLIIRDLAAELCVSMTPVREALYRLIAEGALEARERQSARIPLLSIADIEEIWNIRLRLEPYAVEQAVPLLTSLDIDRLTRYSEEVADAKKHLSTKEISQLVRQFNFHLYRSAALPRLAKMIEDIWASSMPTLGWLLEHEKRDDIAAKYRQDLLKAAKRRDPVAAAQCITDDIKGSFQRVLTAMNI